MRRVGISRPDRCKPALAGIMKACLVATGAISMGAISTGAVSTNAGAQSLQAVPIGAFENPVHVAVAPGEPKLLFVVERAGQIRVLKKERALGKPFLDIRKTVLGPPDSGAGGEQGLLSVAFAPNYRKSGRFYVAFTNKKGDLEIDEFKRSKKTSKRAKVSSRRKVMTVRHRDADNHNGGQLQFGPDGYLYISTGDGGGGGDTFDNARKLNRLLGKLLRIDPRKKGKTAYRVPRSNPYVGKRGEDEIYSYGLRNTWRFAFDGKKLLLADVGQSDREEVNILHVKDAKGANFGWPQYEGDIVFDNSRPGKDDPTFPTFVYDHAGGGCSITGGYVVRDASIPALAGRYLYGDYCTGDIRTFVPGTGKGDMSTGLTLSGIASFGEGFKGQLYAAQLDGTVSRLEAP